MPERSDPAEELARSWEANAAAWTRAVRGGRIASRAAATDAAIVAAVTDRRPRRVLDIGCGEGWLLRRLTREIDCVGVGIDGSGALVDAAHAADPDGDYRHLSYAAFVARPDTVGGGFDAAVLNYALFDEAAADLLATAAGRLAPGGAVIVQTLHPWTVADGRYRDGWRIEAFAGFGEPEDRWAPMPWYFRTLESWLALVGAAGLVLEDLREPAAEGGPPLSLLLVAAQAA